jgi:hypothetical protein
MTGSPCPNRKAMGSLILLTTCDIWNEKNAGVFHKKQVPLMLSFKKIKKEVKL